MSRRRTYSTSVDPGEKLYILAYADPNKNLPAYFSSDSGASFLMLNTIFKLVKGVVSKNGDILCIGEIDGSYRVYISRDQGGSFVEINIPGLSYRISSINIAITSDGSTVYVLNENTLHQYKSGLIHSIKLPYTYRVYENSIFSSMGGELIYTIVKGPSGYHTYLFRGFEAQPLDIGELRFTFASADAVFVGSIEDRYVFIGKHMELVGGSQIKQIDTVDDRDLNVTIGNNEIIYYTKEGTLRGFNFSTEEKKVFGHLREVKDINAVGTVGVITSNTTATMVLSDLYNGEAIKVLNTLSIEYNHIAIGK